MKCNFVQMLRRYAKPKSTCVALKCPKVLPNAQELHYLVAVHVLPLDGGVLVGADEVAMELVIFEVSCSGKTILLLEMSLA